MPTRPFVPEITSDPFGFGPHTMDPILGDSLGSIASADRGLFARVYGSGVISSIGIDIGTQSGNICIAVYRNSGRGRSSVPGEELANTGSIACPAAGFAEVSLGVTIRVEEGDWFALSGDNNTFQFRRRSGNAIDDVYAGRSGYQNSAFPLPSSPSINAAQRIIPLLLGIA